jgi:hypothetical protein
MSLKDFVIATRSVPFRGGSLEVRGLALNDISHLIRRYLAELNTLFQLYEKEETRDTAAAQSVQFAVTIIQETPNLVAQLIVLATDSEPDTLHIAERLPIPVQTEVLRSIIELTFEEAGGAKKFIDSIVSLVTSLRPTTTTGD